MSFLKCCIHLFFCCMYVFVLIYLFIYQFFPFYHITITYFVPMFFFPFLKKVVGQKMETQNKNNLAIFIGSWYTMIG